MDALLRYILYQISYSLLFYELMLMVSACLLIVLTKLITRYATKKRNKNQNEISQLIEKFLLNEEPLDQLIIPSRLQAHRNLVETLEKYDQLFNDVRWRAIKEKIVSTYLSPYEKRRSSSFFWFTRQLVSRTLLLCPHLAKKETLIKLLDDNKYLVRIPAAVCITKLRDRDLFIKVIERMSCETALSQFPYRDAIIQTNEDNFLALSSLLKTEKNKKIIAICLDILSTRYTDDLFDLVKPFMNDTDRTCRVLAVKALGNIPNEQAIKLLIGHLSDSDWEMRAEAITSLQKLYATQSIPDLVQLLQDPIWWVRLQAALTLKSFGREGVEALSSQDNTKSPLAHEIAQYTLALP